MRFLFYWPYGYHIQQTQTQSTYYYLTLFTVFFTQFGYIWTDNNQNCEGDCLKCGKAGCVKCAHYIVYPSRKCVTTCPLGYRARWSHLSEYMGRICVRRDTFLGVSNDTLTVVTGITTGICFCIVVIASALLYLNYKRRLLANMASELSSDTDAEPTPEQRKEFLKQLDTLRPYAFSFLDILNDTRKQLRESWHRDGATVLAVYRPIVRDLAKILLLLNRPLDERTAIPPDDWEHLFAWAEKTLRRCRRMSTTSDEEQPTTGQLINFLQGDTPPSVTPAVSPTNQTVLSTFKPTIEPQILRYADRDGSSNTPWVAFDYSQFDPGAWRSRSSKENLHHHSYFLQEDDEFLGFRPQDEITTEL